MITRQFLLALALIESGNKDVPGDGGLAQGPFQIHPVMVKEVNRILRYPVFNLRDRHDYEASRYMAMTYLHYWSNHLRRKHGWEFSHADLAALWRWGPTQYRPGCATKTRLDVQRTRKLQTMMKQHLKK